VRDVENDLKTECERPLTQEIYQSFTEFKRKSRQAVLNALEDELHVHRSSIIPFIFFIFFISASNSFHLFLVFLDISANSILLSESSENVQLPRRSRSRYGGTHQSCTREHADGICLQKTGLLCPSQKLQQVKILI